MTKAELGRAGEEIACAHLEKHGFTIIARNYHSRHGEIDIIAQSGEILAFVEVKARKAGALVSGLEAVGVSKQQKIIRTAVDYLSKHGMAYQPRFDVVEITLQTRAGKNLYRVNHIESAFDASGFYTPM